MCTLDWFNVRMSVIWCIISRKFNGEEDCKNITQKEVADYLGIKQQQYARYEKGVNIMPVIYLPKICKYLNVSADYILGLSDEKELAKEKVR